MYLNTLWVYTSIFCGVGVYITPPVQCNGTPHFLQCTANISRCTVLILNTHIAQYKSFNYINLSMCTTWNVNYNMSYNCISLYSIKICLGAYCSKIHDIYICDQACENRACGHKLHPITLQSDQYWKSIFPFCNLHHDTN